jgi:Zn ribbon nucleic-acid-binding protein
MSDLLCPKCSANQVITTKEGGRIKITCLNCGHEFRPGEGATSYEDWKNKKKIEIKDKLKLDKQSRQGCAILFLIAIIILIIIKLCVK